MCELDVQSTRDGAVVVIHDETVDRTTNGHGAVADLTLEEMQCLDAGIKFGAKFQGERIPTLEEVMKAVRGRLGLNIEIKEGAVERQVCELMRSCDALATSMVSSFEWKALEKVSAIDPDIRIGLLAEKNPDALIDAASAMRAYGVNPRFDIADAAFCEKAHVTLTTNPLGDLASEGFECLWSTRIISFGDEEEVLLESDEGLDLSPEIAHFFDCIDHGRRPETDGRAAREMIHLVHEAYHKAELEGGNV